MNKILLIEDNKDMRENTAEILSLSNFDVHTAENGKIGVDKAKRLLPDLIICDIMMPELDGYGVLHILGRNPDTAKIPFIFLTAKVDKEDIRRGMNMGADDYLTKPFSDVELMDAVEVRLKKAEILKREYSKGFEGVKEFFTDVMEYKELKDLSAEKDLKIYNKKDIVFREGSYPVGIYYLNKGKVKTFMTNDDAKDYITGLYKEGEFFGYSTILENKPYTESAMTLEESEVCLIPKEEFFNLLYTNKDVAKKFIAMLSNNLLAIEERLIDLAYNSVRKRVAQSLVLLKERYEKENQEDYFNISISREDLANIVGTSKESVIRTLSDFKEEGLVEIKGSNIKIVNWEKLDRMKN